MSFNRFVITESDDSIAKEIRRLTEIKDLTDFELRTVERILNRPDNPSEVLLKMRRSLLKRQDKKDRIDPQSNAIFNKRWKESPVFSHETYRGSDHLNRFYRDWAAYVRAYFGGPKIWTDRLVMSALSGETVTYKGARFHLRTGMDLKDLVLHVIEVNKVRVK